MDNNENDVLCEKIINQINDVFNKDTDLSSFEIIQSQSDHKNKSPVLHVEHNLGLESWCAKHIYDYSHKHIINLKLLKRYTNNDSIIKYVNCALLINPDVTSFWNIRRQLVEKNKLKIQKEFNFSALVLSVKPKSNEAFAYRRWLFSFQNLFLGGESIDWPTEIGISDRCADKSSSNYHAWTHRQWVIQKAPNFLKSEINSTEKFIKKHISDYSCFHYRQFIINKIYELNLYDKEQILNLFNLKNFLNYYLINHISTTDEIPLKLLPNYLKYKNIINDDKLKSFLYCCNIIAYDVKFCDDMKNLYRPRIFETFELHRRACLKFLVNNLIKLNLLLIDNDNDCQNIINNKMNANPTMSKQTKFDTNLEYIIDNHEFLLALKKSEGMLGENHRKWCKLFLNFDYLH